MKSIIFILVLFIMEASTAEPQLILRSHFTQPYNIAAAEFVSNETPRLNSHGDIAILTNKRMLWNCNPDCQVKYQAVEGEFLRLYNYNTFEILSENFYTKGLFTSEKNQVEEILSPEFDFFTVQFFGENKILADGSIVFLAKDGGQNQYVLKQSSTGQLSTILKENQKDKIAFVFNPRINTHGQIVVKVIRGLKNDFSANSTQEIRLYEPDGSFKIIASTGREFTNLDYAISLNDKGEFIFIANTGEEQALYLWNKEKLVQLFSNKDFGKFDAFGPQLNNLGQIVFRGFNKNNKPALFYWHNGNLKTLLTEGDPVETDLGTAQYGQHDPTYPLFSGNVSINNHGTIAYSAGLHPKGDDQTEWGTGLFKLKLIENE